MRIAVTVLIAVAAASCAERAALPIIDMHMHAQAADFNGPPPLAVCAPFPDFMPHNPQEDWAAAFLAMQQKPPCANPIWSPVTDEGVMNETLEVLRRRNIVGVVSGESGRMERVLRWREAASGRIIPAMGFNFGGVVPPPSTLAQLHEQGQFVVLGEVGIQYDGVSPSDERFEPYLAMAEARDIPVGIHIGTGPAGSPYLGTTGYRARLHSALVLEEALVRHPKLRVYIMHAGWPMLDDLLAVLWTHPQVYTDIAVIDWAIPRAEFHRYLQRIVAAGFGRRVMFGSDQMTWPGVIERALEAIESAPFLLEEQKRDILYNNAARFLRLSDDEIATHHGR